MSARKITIVSGLQIIDNPRVVKEADALAEMGFDVEVLAAVHNLASRPRIESLLEGRLWRHTAVIDRTRRGAAAMARQTFMRGSAKAWREVGQKVGLEHPMQLGIAAKALCRAALASRADLYSLHLEQALWTGKILADKNIPFRIDVEDWYSEDGLPSDRAARPLGLMKRCERLLLNRAVHATTTSRAMAGALADAYGCPAPEVVYNSFPSAERATVDRRRLDRRSLEAPSIIWFSQTIGPGRGLEALVAAFARLDMPAELHLRGTPRPGYVERLLAPLPANLRNLVFVHPQVAQSELLSRLVEHDIGYCGELSDCRNRDLTITNKMLECMRAGLAIVASDTAGQCEVATKAPGAVSLFRQGDAGALGAALRPLLADAERLRRAKALSWAEFDVHFGWGASRNLIQAQVARFFDGGPLGRQ